MNIIIVSGSHRANGNSGRIGRFITQQLAGQGHAAAHLNLAETELPLWDEGLWGNEALKGKWETLWSPWEKKLNEADCAILVAPEYHGIVPPRLQNFLLLATEGSKPLAHKPALLVSVSASINGAYPIAELRATGAKNNRMLFIPEHIIVRNAGNMLLENVPAEHAKFDAELRERLEKTTALLLEYAAAVKPVQQNAREFLKKYPNGM